MSKQAKENQLVPAGQTEQPEQAAQPVQTERSAESKPAKRTRRKPAVQAAPGESIEPAAAVDLTESIEPAATVDLTESIEPAATVDLTESTAPAAPKRRRTRKPAAKQAQASAESPADAESTATAAAEADVTADSDAESDRESVEFSGNAFSRMGLSTETLAAVKAMGFSQPTAIQEETIPPMMDWRDVIAQAPTGTGKTVAFGIPIIEHFDPTLTDVQALILAPTRELALQITDELRSLAQNRPEIRIATIYGGQRIDVQLDQLKHRPQIIVATPGRLIDHLNRRTVSLGSVRTVVLDEADRMLDMGFVRDVRKILDKMPRAWQVTMFSATMSRAVMDISWIYQRDVIELKVVPEAENKPQITQYSIEIGAHRRIEAIAELMKKHNYQKAIVFCNRKHVTDYVARRLSSSGIRAASIHGDIQQSTREKTLSSFRTGSLRVLVATDVAARGIDVEGVDAVFNYDIPDENEYYVHRIGRTGRARHEGVAYTFTTMLTQPKLDEIMRYTKCEIIPLAME